MLYLPTAAKPIQAHPTKLSGSIRKVGRSSTARPTANLAMLQVEHLAHYFHFSAGKVLKLVASAGMRKAVILFHKFGEEALLLNYAKLDILPSI